MNIRDQDVSVDQLRMDLQLGQSEAARSSWPAASVEDFAARERSVLIGAVPHRGDGVRREIRQFTVSYIFSFII